MKTLAIYIQCLFFILCIGAEDGPSKEPDLGSEATPKPHDHAKFSGFTLDDSSWKIVWHGSTDTELLNAPNMESILMLTKDNEQYNCQLENSRRLTKDEDVAYEGPNPLELLEPLFSKMACSYRLESYWTYEVCHGDFVRQYHETKEGKQTKLIEYFLGRYSKDTLKSQIAELDAAIAAGTAASPKKLRLEELDLPYLEVPYRDGTVCDLTGRPRETLVRYVCHAGGRHELVSFQESSSCQYVIVVLSPLLCSHPDYRVTADVENSIHCIALSNSPKRPRSLLELESESLGAAPPPDGAEPAAAAESKASPVYDEKLVNDFLAGRHCLNGGSGWWRYEFCYGKRVDQYHVNRDGSRTTLHLGFFSHDVHRQWLRANPLKRPKPVPARRHVSHFYSGGTMCDESGAPRSVEVKLKCKLSDSPNAVSLYLLEPRTCEYILGVESPIICGLIDSADEDGLLDR
ncbi:endoplasmic reticulum lectin 1-like [Pollicipes pollicipes]|uniref:endoplasmic reticulum lectin 1-like n=1 Tax=Pollicipes pollicipes TaxID=41117 RepID=UPI001884BCDD|nr:endoplasmic reticulum lectin 1-like [Pollicipes pollicipes]